MATSTLRLILAAFVGATMAASATLLFDPIAPPRILRFGFPPDLSALAARLDMDVSGLGARAATGGLTAAVIAARIRRGGVLLVVLALANPLLIFAFLRGADWTLFFAAMFTVWAAIVALIAERDYRATVGLGVALAVAALLHNGIVATYPIVLLLTPLLSPWGIGARRLAGFAVAIWTPLAMVSLSLAYLYWLLGASEPMLQGTIFTRPGAVTAEALLIVAGAGLLAIAARLSSFIALAAATAGAAAALVTASIDLSRLF